MSTAEDGRFYARVFGLAAAALLALLLLNILKPFFESILWAGLLAFLLAPVDAFLARKLGGRPALSALLLTVAGALFVLIPAVMTAVVFAGQATVLVGRLQELADRYRITHATDVFQVPAFDQLFTWIGKFVPVPPEQIQAWALDGGKALLALLVASSGAFFAGVLGVVVEVGLTLFLLFFFLRDGREMVTRALVLVPMTAERKADLVDHLAAVIRAVALGTLFTAVVQGTLVGMSFAFTGLPSPVVFGVLAMLAALVPLVGSSLVWVPAAFVLIAHNRVGAAVFLAFWGLVVVSVVDNIVRPLVVSGRAQISTLPVLLGLVGGLATFGAIGFILGPVVIALALALFRFAEEEHAA
ncbi:MAG TPA: AI-2E family transporter [Methylomirabilota bacterium]